MMDDIRARAREIAADYADRRSSSRKTMAAGRWRRRRRRCRRAIERAAQRSSNLESSRLPSGAGHDAQMMALLGPMGMIFVPSVGGISHSPDGADALGRLRARRERAAADDSRDRQATTNNRRSGDRVIGD
mgnify:CR=1 FL=1